MSKSLQHDFERAIRKRDRWSRKADELAIAIALGQADAPATPHQSNLSRVRQQYRSLPNFSEIAREQRVTPGHVRRVFFGLTVSERIAKAITDKLAILQEASA